nr:TetR/AcrR family transcriptional regulator [uncultured Friedmanniella sp.]
MNRMNVDQRRGKLVDAAIVVMLRDGVARTTTRSIVSEAGMTTGAFHYCFFSKEELELEVMRVLNAHAYEAVLQQLHADATGTELVERVVVAFVDALVTDAPRRQLSFELTLHALRTEGLSDAAVKHYRASLDNAEAFLDDMARVGGFTWRLPPADLARLCMSVAEGVAFHWVVTDEDGSGQQLKEVLNAFLCGQVVAREDDPVSA